MTAAIARGLSAHKAGRLAAAERSYRAVLAAEPANAQALHLLGVVLLQRGDAEGARSLLARAAALDPGDADCHNRLGLACAALGTRAEAEAAYRRAIARAPRHPEAHNNLGIVLAAAGETQAAVEAYRAALAAKPDFALAHNNLGVALAGLGRVDEAERHYRAALESDPAYADAAVNLAGLMLRRDRAEAAASALREVVERRPDHLAARLLLADALLRAGEPEAALAHYEAVLARDPAPGLNPGVADARGNRALALAALGRLAEAEAEAERAAALAPHAVHRMNLAMLLLLRGALVRGFREYRWRFGAGLPWLVPRPFPQPRWDGGPGGLLVWGEQGVGEEVMFASLLPRLAAHGRVVVECDPRLVPLFRRSFPFETVARTTPPDPATLDPGISHQVAMGDLAAALALGPEDLASPAAYLVADPARVATIRARYEGLGRGPKVGIAWRSRGPNRAFSAAKSSPLAAWNEVLRVPEIRFVKLQYGDCTAELAEAARETGVRVFADPEIDQARDLDGFAAQLAALDLVITTSNTTAHLAGALGCEVWVLLPHVADWRWQHGRDDSLWYPRARLIRQPRPGDWAGALAGAARRLAGTRR